MPRFVCNAQVINGSVFVTPPDMVLQSRERTAMYQLAHLYQTYELPDLDFMLYTSDFCPSQDLPHRSHDGKYDRCPRLVGHPLRLLLFRQCVFLACAACQTGNWWAASNAELRLSVSVHLK